MFFSVLQGKKKMSKGEMTFTVVCQIFANKIQSFQQEAEFCVREKDFLTQILQLIHCTNQQKLLGFKVSIVYRDV